MPSLRKSKSGSYIARGRIPTDVRDEYGRRFGKRLEVKFSAPPSTKPADARRQYADWLAEHEARVASIRAERNGGGATLTHRQAYVLAADWYRWFVARHIDEPGNPISWDVRADIIHRELRDFAPDAYESNRPFPEEAIEAVLPRIADDAETQQFLAQQGVTLDRDAHTLFLRAVFDHYSAALRRLEAYAEGDYSPDKHAAKLPPPLECDTAETPWQLFEAWVVARGPAQGTIENWQYMLRNLTHRFEGRSAGSITVADARDWLNALIGRERTARTVYKTWKRAAQTVFQWGVDQQRLTTNPFAAIKTPRTQKSERHRKRREKHFRSDELSTILRAAQGVQETRRPDAAAKRWVPWILAYTGARPAEITQLRGIDVRERDGVPFLHLTPEAGTIKSNEPRDVPLHEHLRSQGFLEWVRERGSGPLFYAPRKNVGDQGKRRPKKPPAAQARQRLAAWVRSLGVSDPHLSPNHAWRHTFKLYAERHGISERLSDVITGHAPASVGRQYGKAELRDMADALKRFPRYDI